MAFPKRASIAAACTGRYRAEGRVPCSAALYKPRARWQWRAPHPVIEWGESDRRPSCHASIILSTFPAFEVSSKRRKGYPSETNVKRGLRFVRGGPDDDESVELVEKLGRKNEKLFYKLRLAEF
jgi:hypothetical protein